MWSKGCRKLPPDLPIYLCYSTCLLIHPFVHSPIFSPIYSSFEYSIFLRTQSHFLSPSDCLSPLMLGACVILRVGLRYRELFSRCVQPTSWEFWIAPYSDFSSVRSLWVRYTQCKIKNNLLIFRTLYFQSILKSKIFQVIAYSYLILYRFGKMIVGIISTFSYNIQQNNWEMLFFFR